MQRKQCAICNDSLKNIYTQEKIPISLSCTNTPTINCDKLSFSQCCLCNTIQLDHLIPLNILYGESHNYKSVGKTWENYFSLFLSKLHPIIENKTILEIGCPSGKLALKSENYQKWFIVEPNKNKTVNFHDKIHFIESFFDDDFTTNESIDIITHSHLFEHIYNPNQFLKKCYEILSDEGEMIFGVPTMEHFTTSNKTPFLGVFFEHTVYLCKENISYLLHKNNFKMVEIIDYENHSTIYHCKKEKIINQNIPQIIPQIRITDYYDHFMESVNYYKIFVEHCNEKIMNTTKDVYIFGASYYTQILLSFGIKNIKRIFDNCKEKQNKYLYGFELMVYHPDILTNDECIVIVKNGYYTDEIIKQLKSINENIEIIF